MMRVYLLTFLTGVFASLAAVASAQGRPAGVQTQIVEMREMTETVTVFGQIVSVRESDVATRVSGVISEVPVQVGTKLSEGDIIARMDTARLRIELGSAEAELSIANAGLEVANAQKDRAEKTFRRAEALSQNSAISSAQVEERASDLAEAEGGIAQAKARISAAENKIALADYNLRNATIRAPFDGVVLSVSAQPGQFASSGSTMATLLDSRSLEVEANVPSRFIDALEVGTTVSGQSGMGGELRLELRAVLPTEYSETRTRPVRFALFEDPSPFAIGETVTLDIPIGVAREVLTVSKDALVQGQGGWTAFVNEDGKASPRQVTIGNALGDAFEVIDGLSPGDEVVVRGNERLRPGQDISPIDAGGPEGGEGASAPAGGTPSGQGGETEAERG